MDYLLHVGVMVALYTILASSFNLLIGYAGLFALSHAAFFGVGAYVTAILAATYGVPFPLPLIAGMLVVAALGMVIALPALRIGGDYLVIVTLALQVIVTTVLLNWTSLTGGTDGIRAIPRIEMFGQVLDRRASSCRWRWSWPSSASRWPGGWAPRRSGGRSRRCATTRSPPRRWARTWSR
ncbi:MAG: branched-chain amino acid ABC transporter permease [Burkholderiaceae bacterium]